jgi:hypothetical protein
MVTYGFAEIFLDWDMFQQKFVDKIKTQFLCKRIPKLCRLWDNVENYVIARQFLHKNITRRMRCLCWITKSPSTHSEFVILVAFPGKNYSANPPQYYVINTLPVLLYFKTMESRSLWPSCPRWESAANRLLGLRVRIQQGAWMSLSSECCVFCKAEVPATGRSLI